MKQLDKILSEALVRKGILPSERIQECAVIAQSQGKSLEHYLIEKNILPRQEILDVLASELKCSAVNLRTVPIDRLVIEKIPVKFVLYYKFMPIEINDKKSAFGMEGFFIRSICRDATAILSDRSLLLPHLSYGQLAFNSDFPNGIYTGYERLLACVCDFFEYHNCLWL